MSATEFFDAEDSLAEKTAIYEPGDDERDEESEVRRTIVSELWVLK